MNLIPSNKILSRFKFTKQNLARIRKKFLVEKIDYFIIGIGKNYHYGYTESAIKKIKERRTKIIT